MNYTDLIVESIYNTLDDDNCSMFFEKLSKNMIYVDEIYYKLFKLNLQHKKLSHNSIYSIFTYISDYNTINIFRSLNCLHKSQDHTKRNLLHWICFNDNLPLFKLLLDYDNISIFNYKDIYGETPIFDAVRNNNFEMVKILYEKSNTKSNKKLLDVANEELKKYKNKLQDNIWYKYVCKYKNAYDILDLLEKKN